MEATAISASSMDINVDIVMATLMELKMGDVLALLVKRMNENWILTV